MIKKVFVAQLQIHFKLHVNINCAAAQRMKRRDAGILSEETQTWDMLHTPRHDHRISPSD